MWGILTALGMPVIAAAEAEQAGPEAGIVVETPAPATRATREPGSKFVQFLPGTAESQQSAEPKDSKYWLGLSCAPVDETLRSQLGLDARTGLVIRQIADKSPAKEAGLVVHDVITEVKVGDATAKPADIGQLTTCVQQAEGKPMTFSLLRQGKPLSVTFTPRERNVASRELQLEATRLRQLVDDLNLDLSFRMAGPVVAFDRANAVAAFERANPASANLPDDLTVVITKSGSEPMHVTIRKKDRGEWRLKENETAAQPEEISWAVIKVMAYLSQLVGRVDQHEGKPVFRLEPAANVQLRLAEQLGLVPTRVPLRDELRAATPAGPSATITYQEREPFSTQRQSVQQRSFQQQLDAIQKQQEQMQKLQEQMQRQHEEMTKAFDELRQSRQKLQPQN